MNNNENGTPNATLFNKLKKNLETAKEVFKLSSRHHDVITDAMIEVATVKIRFKKTEIKFFSYEYAQLLSLAKNLYDAQQHEVEVANALQGVKGKNTGKIITKSESGLNNALSFLCDMTFKNFNKVLYYQVTTFISAYFNSEYEKMGRQTHEFDGETVVAKQRDDVAFTQLVKEYTVDALFEFGRDFSREKAGGKLRDDLQKIGVEISVSKPTVKKESAPKEDTEDEITLDLDL